MAVVPVPAGTSNSRIWNRAVVHGDPVVMAHVLVTGGTGFLGSHTIARLLASGHKVTTTLRSLKRQPDPTARRSAATALPGIRGRRKRHRPPGLKLIGTTQAYSMGVPKRRWLELPVSHALRALPESKAG